MDGLSKRLAPRVGWNSIAGKVRCRPFRETLKQRKMEAKKKKNELKRKREEEISRVGRRKR